MKMNVSTKFHIPVLLMESVEGMNIDPNGIYVDLTFGGGGHSREILKRLDKGHLFAFDQDIDVIDRLTKDNNFTFVQSNFRYAGNFLKYFEVGKVDGVLADLGVSSHHFDRAERGFSFRQEGELDMRMNRSIPKTAASILNTYGEYALEKIFGNYGELNDAKRLAKQIVEIRRREKIKTTFQLVKLLRKHTSQRFENKYMAKVFQALRIEVNDELLSLKIMLQHIDNWLHSGGRLVVISYHSLEDRMVKNFIRSGNVEGKISKDERGNVIKPFMAINKKVIQSSYEEIRRNNKARSAKLRIAERAG